jgi:hypothetical protein
MIKININLVDFSYRWFDNVHILCLDDVMVLFSSAMDRRFDLTFCQTKGNNIGISYSGAKNIALNINSKH